MELPELDSKKTWWKLGPAVWVGIAILVAMNVAVFSGGIHISKNEVAWTVYSLDPRLWPSWTAIALWLIVLAKFVHWRFGRDGFFKFTILTTLGVIASLIGYMVYVQFFVRTTIGKKGAFWTLYNMYVLSPMTKLADRGEVDGKILIAPALAALAVAYIVFLYRYQKKHDIRWEIKPRWDILVRIFSTVKVLVILTILATILTIVGYMVSQSGKSPTALQAAKDPLTVYYNKNVIGPWSNLFEKGTVDRKLLIMPGGAGALIVVLLLLKQRNKPKP